MSPARIPHNTALGTPMIVRPTAITTPKPTLSAVCIKKKRLSREPASSRAAVLRCRSSVPAKRRNRSRRSSRPSRMNNKNRITSAVVVSGDRSGRTRLAIDSSPVGWGCFTSTRTGFGAGGTARAPVAGGVGLGSSSCNSRSVSAARSMLPEAAGDLLKARTLARRLLSYFGKSSASCVICRPMV